jgi:hypothetical protein
MPWVPDKVTFQIHEAPLRYTRIAGDWPDGTGEVANLLNKLGLPLNVSTKDAVKALRDQGEPRRRQVVSAACRWRRERQ